ncbi:DUF2197 domain-containing protein [Mechercharimyces sp. CAU 1602]|uniref:DUF2197 domain-containing protein n=1 Tax=Mechercharimyces sp. CAU 1602 TaxID=2973933 RepID=UPI0037C9960D
MEQLTCILCDRPFTPNNKQSRRLQKHPHRMFLCPQCDERITFKTMARRGKKASGHPLSFPQRKFE